MPESYDIDPGRALVVCRAWGEFSNRDLQEHYRRLAADPAFDAEFAQLGDLRGVTDFTVDSAVIESAARQEIFAPGTPRAFVAPKGVAFGFGADVRVVCAGGPEGCRLRTARGCGGVARGGPQARG